MPAPCAADAALEAIDSSVQTVVIITEHVPIKDSVELIARARQANATIIGPNPLGIIAPGRCKLGIMPANVFTRDSVGAVSRNDTLTCEIAAGLNQKPTWPIHMRRSWQRPSNGLELHRPVRTV